MFNWLRCRKQKVKPPQVILDEHGFLEVNLADPRVVARLSVMDEASSEELRSIQKRIKSDKNKGANLGAESQYSQYTVQVEHELLI